MRQQILSYFKNKFPERKSIQVTEPSQITEGWETDIFSFEIEYTQSGKLFKKNIIMRMFPGDEAKTKSIKEFSAMKKLFKAGYPVPEVYVHEWENSLWRKPFILMERIDGNIMWPKLIHSAPEKQETLLTQFCNLFIKLHRLDWHSLTDDFSQFVLNNKYQFIDKILPEANKVLLNFEPTGFLSVLNWLEDNRDLAGCDYPSPIHFDFHPGNILLKPDGAAIVIDWSGFDITDSRFDLAWTLVLLSSYEGSTWRDKILNKYEQLQEKTVKNINYFEVYACVRRLFTVVTSVQDGSEKMGMNPKAVKLIKDQMYAHKRVYKMLIKRTGIHIHEVEELFNAFH